MEYAGIILLTDGSDDGLAAGKTVARLVDPHVVAHVTLVAVAWPERESALGDKAEVHRLPPGEDLHAAIAIAADHVLKQLRAELLRHTQVIDEITITGEPAEGVLKVISEIDPDIVFVTVTRGARRRNVNAWVVPITEQAHCPLVVMHGTPPLGLLHRSW